MKLKNINILFWLIMLVTLALSSCRDDTFTDYWDNSDTFTVTLNVGLEDMSATREGQERPALIGNGSKIDMLVYAVYYYNTSDPANPKWDAVEEYMKENDDSKKWGIQKGHGQTVIDVSGTLDQGGKYPITLTLKKGEDYKVVFWAQNHTTEAFVIDDLKKVQMKYKINKEKDSEDGDPSPIDEEGEDGEDSTNSSVEETLSLNNDETRDAFCRSVSLNSNQANRNITIYLRRPLAQINIGTRGFDFESITRNADVKDKYLYSKIRINRAARYLDVVEDKVYTTTIEDPTGSSTEAFYTIDYEYNKIPAYWKWNKEEDGCEVPDYPSYTIYDLENTTGAFDTFFDIHDIDMNNKSKEERYRELYEKEEFLKVHLYTDSQLADTGFEKGDDGYVTYSSMGNALDTSKDEDLDRSEIFKYLSMCYVLTNSSDDAQDVLTNVKVWLANEDHTKEVEVVNVTNVPVQRNHRTNIVGSLLTAKASMQIIVDDDFAGRKINGTANIQSGEITEGFYYDADADEFQISSVNGLLFFQQLVNGKLAVRQIGSYGQNRSVKVGDPYPYFVNDTTTFKSLKYKSYSYSEIEANKANIIIKGSRYDQLAEGNKTSTSSGKTWNISVDPDNSTGWPKNHNFPFYGAKVKLMADIDLAGIDWIPIGFDCASWDNTFGNYSNGTWTNCTYSEKDFNYISLVSNGDTNEIGLGDRRAFCGTFDGNGHTIYNLQVLEFGPDIHKSAYQGSANGGPFDNVQWFAKGFFGVVGPGAVIKDLRLQNVKIQGSNSVGAIVGQVSSIGFPAKIVNCIVDGGTIDAIPLYRAHVSGTNFYGRTMARGCYIGGIVGQFVAKDDMSKAVNGIIDVEKDYDAISEISGCEVRNLTIRGYRRMGGIVGAIADQGAKTMANSDIQIDITVEGNSISNSLIIVDQYRPFNYYWDFMGLTNVSGNNYTYSDVWMNGFGWGTSGDYTPMSNYIVGGYFNTAEELAAADPTNHDAFSFGYSTRSTDTGKEKYYNHVHDHSVNKQSNLKYTELASTPNVNNGTGGRNAIKLAEYRLTTIKNVPLIHIPMLTSIYTDHVILEDNYYGETDLKTQLKFYDCPIWVGYNPNYKFKLPLNFPLSWDVTYEPSDNTKTGLYVESVDLDGSRAPGGRSVITPLDVDGPNSCVMYITARDRIQFMDKKKPDKTNDLNWIATQTQIKTGEKYRASTSVNQVVLRGSPYAWAGIILAPNENMSEVNLTNVTIYDVYQTLALQEVKTNFSEDNLQNYTFWKKYQYTSQSSNNSTTYNMEGIDDNKDDVDDLASISLNVTKCNLRGYTVPGPGWNHIYYDSTTFEQGAETKYSSSTKKEGYKIPDMRQFKTCKVEAPTDFEKCYFKAPFYIDLKDASSVTFTDCYASSAYGNAPINVKNGKYNGQDVSYISIERNTVKGQTVVTYYNQQGNEIK